jgi:hypothetical protein
MNSRLAFLFLACLHAFGSNNIYATEDRYYVEEFMDEIIVASFESKHNESGIKDYQTIYFIRNKQIMAKRNYQHRRSGNSRSSILWSVLGDHFALSFEGYGYKDGNGVFIDRVILTKKIMFIVLPDDPLKDDRNAKWWAQNRNMRNFKDP